MDEKFIYGPKNISSIYTFNAGIEEVWELLIDSELSCKIIFGDIFQSFSFTKENRADIIGSEFKVQSHVLTYFFKCIDLLVEPNTKKISFQCRSEKKDFLFNYDFTYTVISNTIDATTIFFWDMEFETSENEVITSEILDQIKARRYFCLKRWSDHFLKNAKECTQYESVMIDLPRKEVWDIISNWTVLASISPSISHSHEYSGDHLTEGTHLKLTYNYAKIFVCDFKIVKVNSRGDESEDWEYFMILYKSTPKIPYQEIRFAITYLSPQNCFLTFQHIYKERLNIRMLEKISKEKRGVLNDIKCYLEKHSV